MRAKPVILCNINSKGSLTMSTQAIDFIGVLLAGIVIGLTIQFRHVETEKIVVESAAEYPYVAQRKKQTG